MLNKIDNMKDLVTQFLQNYPETRDNDRLLMLKVWAHECPNLRNSDTSFKGGFAEPFLGGSFADPESIRRTRQKVQEANPFLRGRKYVDRKKHAETVRQEMRS